MSEIISLLKDIVFWIYEKAWKEPKAFEMKFTEPTFNLPVEQQVSRTFSNAKVLPLGEHTLFFRIMPKYGMIFTTINLRFVNRHGLLRLQFKDAPKSKVEILTVEPYDKMKMLELEREHSFEEIRELGKKSQPYFKPDTILLANQFYRGEPWFDRQHDQVGGCFLTFKPPYERPPSEPLWIAAKVIGREGWKGYISLQIQRKDEARKYIRLPVVVKSFPDSVG